MPPNQREAKIPNTIDRAFSGCTDITKVNYLGDLKGWCEISWGDYSANPLYGANYNKEGTAKLYLNDEEVTEVKDLDGVESIPGYAFNGLVNLSSVAVPDSVTGIGYGAFSGCTGLQTLIIGEGVQHIGERAFYNCTELQTVTIGENVTSIYDDTFSGCTGITKVNYLGNIKGWCGIFFDNIFSNPLSSGGAQLYVKENNIESEVTGNVNFPTGIDSINSHAFYALNGITSIIIPDSVTRIGDRAFYGCTGLQTATIGKGVQRIGDYAFHRCTGLQTVYWNATNCTYMGSFRFEYTNLKTVIIGGNVRSIPSYTFHNCTDLRDIYYEYGEGSWSGISKGYHWNDYYKRDYPSSSSGSYITINYTMHYNSTGPEAASNISALPSDQPVLIACDKLDLWVKQDQKIRLYA